jgi:hypothetical protein
MAFPIEILRSGVKLADKLTAGAQAPIVIEPWQSQNGDGTITYGTGVSYQAVIDTTRKQLRTGSGELLIVTATLTIVGDVLPAAGGPYAGRIEPIDPRDRVTLPDGKTAPILSVPNSVVDPGTDRGLIHEILLGAL